MSQTLCAVLCVVCHRLMQPDGSESDSMADYNISTQPDKAYIQEKVQSVSVSLSELSS